MTQDELRALIAKYRNDGTELGRRVTETLEKLLRDFKPTVSRGTKPDRAEPNRGQIQ
jgi:hypothetical protein